MYYKSCWECVLCMSLTLILLSTIVPPVNSCWGSTSTKLGDITPDHMLLDGSPLLIDCSLNRSSNNTIEYESNVYRVDSSMLLFKFDSQVISKDRIHLINDTVARLEVKKASVTDNGMYYCQLNISGLNHRPLVCLTHITVGYKPQSVIDFKCISLHYRKLHCSWTPPNNPIPTTYRLEDKYHASIDHLSRKCGNIPSDNSCEWTVDTVPPYRNTALKFNLVLTGSNQFGNRSQLFVVDHYSIIKPNVPKNFGQIEVTTTKISLSWSPPEYIEFDEELLENIIYEIRYFSQYPDHKGKSQTIILDGIRQTSLNLTDLVPYLKYNISIRCKTIQSKSEEYWSEFSSIVIQTKDDVPYLAPELIPESFQTDKNMEGSRSITLFWKEIPFQYQNGPDFYYMIECFDLKRRKSRTINLLSSNGGSDPIRSQNTTNTFNNMRTDIAYKFSVYGINSKGLSSNSSEIIVERNDVIPHKPSNIDVYSYGGGRYEVQWTKPRENSMSGPITNYTVFWCRNLRPRPFICEGAIDWISTKNTSIVLELPDIGVNYQFAVSANALKSSSGMSWAECIVPIDGRLDKLSDVQLKGLNSTSILVNWKLNCPAQKRVVEGYKIKFCSIDKTEEEANSYCFRPESVETDNSVESFILNGLEPFTKYRITVLAYSDSGPSEESDPRFIITFHGSPYAPSALEAINTTSHTISLMWRLPIKTNGHISHHKIKSNDKIYEISDNCNETHCWYTIENLLSYKYYEIEVQACNSQSLCSLDSNTLKILTSRDVPFIMDPPRSEIINSTTVRLSWSPPIVTNGPIDAYLIKLIRSDNSTEVFNISGKMREYFVTIDCQREEDSPNVYSQYFVQMSSENVLENGKHLTADFGDTTNLNACIGNGTGLGWNYAYIAGLVAGISFGLVVMVLVLVVLYRKVKKCYDSIRNVKVEIPSRLQYPGLTIDTQLDDGPQFDPYSRSDSYPNIGLGAIGDSNSINKNRHISGLSQTSNDSTERLYNKTTTKTKDNFFRLVSDESGQHESVSSNEAHMSSDSGVENDIQNNKQIDIQFVNKVSSDPSLTILDENNSDSSGSKDSGINPKSLRNKKPTKRKPNNLKTNTKISSMVRPTPDRNEVTNPLYDTPMSHSVCIYSLLANSEPSLFEIPVREDDNILSDLSKFSKPEMAKSLTNIIQNYNPSDPKVNCIICETNNSSSRNYTRTSSPNCPYYKYGIKRQNHNQNNHITDVVSPERNKEVKANVGYITLDSIQESVVPKSPKKRLEHDWSQNSYDAEVSSTSSNGDNEQTDVLLLTQSNPFSESCLTFTECEKIQNKIQNNPSIEDNTELNVIDSSVDPLNPLNTSLNEDIVIEFEPKLNAIKDINTSNGTTTLVKTSPTHLVKDSNGYVLHNTLNLMSGNQIKPNLIKNSNGYVVLDSVQNGIEMTDYVPKENVVNHVTQV